MSRHLHKIQPLLVGATRRPIDVPSSNGDQQTYILVVRARVLPFIHYLPQHGCAIWLRQYNGFVRSPDWVCLETFPEDYSTTHTLAPAQNTLPVETLFLFGCAVIVHRVEGLLGNKLAFLAGNQGNGSERPFVTLQRWFQAQRHEYSRSWAPVQV